MTDKKLNVAMVDVAQLVANSKDMAELRKEQNVKNHELQSWANSMNAEIEKESSAEAKMGLMQKGQVELNEKKQAIAVEHHQKLQKIDVQLTDLIAEEAKAQKFDYVFAKGTILFGATDITADVIKRLK